MVGGGIFTILGIAVALIGVYTPLAIMIGGFIAALAAYSYIQLALLYKDEGATYSFFKKTFPRSHFAASLIGWCITFGYITTIALYAYTFASYAISGSAFAEDVLVRKLVAGGIITVFALINIWSVTGMGKIEDLMVYTKLVILAVISFVLINNSGTSIPTLVADTGPVSLYAILIVASLTFVAYEGFQLVIHATNEMEAPDINIPRAIYAAIGMAIAIYVIIALGALFAIPFEDIISNQEYALASGAGEVLGHWGTDLVILGAVLATCSAISGTLFGASRLLAVIASDGYFPKRLGNRTNHIPIPAVLTMSATAMALIAMGNLRVILEFSSMTFILVSFLMALANFKVRKATKSSTIVTVMALVFLAGGGLLIIAYEISYQPEQVLFMVACYAALTAGAFLYARVTRRAHI
jgi:amino acid transporter